DRQRVLRGQAHRAGEAGCSAAVLARVAPGADLARILHRGAGLRAGQQVDLQQVWIPVMADRGGGGVAVGEPVTATLGAAVAEQLVALGVAAALVDCALVVPDTQHLAFVAAADELAQLRVGDAGRTGGAAVLAFIQFQRSAPWRPCCTGPSTCQASSDAGTSKASSGTRNQRGSSMASLLPPKPNTASVPGSASRAAASFMR